MGVSSSNLNEKTSNIQIDDKINFLIEKIENIQSENIILKKEIEKLKNENIELKDNSFNFSSKNKENLKKFVDNWYEKNSNNIDIGIIDLPFGGSIDILPDNIEKHLYLKTITILMEMISQFEINFMGQKIIFNFPEE